MDIKETTLDGVKEIHMDTFIDHRGDYVEIHNKKMYKAAIGDIKFVQALS